MAVLCPRPPAAPPALAWLLQACKPCTTPGTWRRAPVRPPMFLAELPFWHGPCTMQAACHLTMRPVQLYHALMGLRDPACHGRIVLLGGGGRRPGSLEVPVPFLRLVRSFFTPFAAQAGFRLRDRLALAALITAGLPDGLVSWSFDRLGDRLGARGKEFNVFQDDGGT